MRRTLALLVTVVVLLAVAVLYVVSAPGAKDLFRSRSRITDEKTMNKMIFGYVGNPYTDDYQNSRIPGYMRNESKQEVASIDLEIDLYSSKGDRKEIIKYTVRDVAPGQRKSFDANAGTLDGPRTAKVKILSVEVVK